MSAKPSRVIVCIATAALFAVAGPPVWAGTWGGAFDPAGGGAVTGFNGTDLINIAGSDCLPGGSLPDSVNFFYVNGFGDNNCDATLLNANVTLQSDVGDTAQLFFGPSQAIWGIDVGLDGTLLGVDSFLIGPAFPPEGSNSIFDGPWFIQLSAQDGEPPPCDGNCIDPPPNTPSNVVILSDGTTFTSNPYTFFAVPEPGSIWLLLGALGAGWLTTRRRKAGA